MDTTGRGNGGRWAALTLAVLAVGLDGTVLSVAVPTLATELNASESDLQWFSSAYLLVLAAAMLPAGLLGDRYRAQEGDGALAVAFWRRFGGLRLLDHGGAVHRGAGGAGAGGGGHHGDGALGADGALHRGGAATGGRHLGGGELPGAADRADPGRVAADELTGGAGSS